MGRKRAEVSISASLSAHNDEQDDIDRQMWARFLAEVRALAEKPQYKDLDISFWDY